MISSFTLFFKSACLYSSYEVKVQKISYEITVEIQDKTLTTETFTQEGQYTLNFTNPPTEGTLTLLTTSGVETRSFTRVDKEIFFYINAFLGSGTYQGQETWLKSSEMPVFHNP